MSEHELEPGRTVQLVTGRTDADLAAEIRAELNAALAPVALILDRARQNGLTVSFGVNPDQYGRFRISDIGIVRPL